MVQVDSAINNGSASISDNERPRRTKYTEELIIGKCREYWREINEVKLLSGSSVYEVVIVIEAHIDHPDYGEGDYEYIFTIAANNYNEMRNHIDNIKDNITPTNRSWVRIPNGGNTTNIEDHGHANKAGYKFKKEYEIIVKWMKSCPV